MADEGLEGSLDMLKDSFSYVVSNGEFGIFAIGVDQTDPDFAAGSAILFMGDDGWFRQTSPRIDAAALSEMADVLSAASDALQRICVSRHGQPVLRSRNADEVPDVTPMNGDERRHVGLLAAEERFSAFASPQGGQLDRVALSLMLADSAAGEWRRVVHCHSHWLPRLKMVTDLAVERLLITPCDPASPMP